MPPHVGSSRRCVVSCERRAALLTPTPPVLRRLPVYVCALCMPPVVQCAHTHVPPLAPSPFPWRASLQANGCNLSLACDVATCACTAGCPCTAEPASTADECTRPLNAPAGHPACHPAMPANTRAPQQAMLRAYSRVGEAGEGGGGGLAPAHLRLRHLQNTCCSRSLGRRREVACRRRRQVSRRRAWVWRVSRGWRIRVVCWRCSRGGGGRSGSAVASLVPAGDARPALS